MSSFAFEIFNGFHPNYMLKMMRDMLQLLRDMLQLSRNMLQFQRIMLQLLRNMLQLARKTIVVLVCEAQKSPIGVYWWINIDKYRQKGRAI